MTTSRIDYRALFAVSPSPYLVLDPDLVVVDVNQAYLRVTGRTREEMIGRRLFEVHPDNPADPDADGVRNLNASLQRVLRSREPDTMAVQKYDVPVSGQPGVFREKWWSPVNTPLLGPDGQVEWLLHRVEDMTEFVLTRPLHSRPEDPESEHKALESELYVRAQELQHLNEELRNAHARERHIALTLQEAMLHSPDLAAHREIAVRYLPAARSLNVCGDWYDVVDLSEDTYTVAVGDVVGHGLEAAAVMGMLRSALSAAVRAIHEPGVAMDVLSRYAGTFEGALATTAVKAVIDTRRQRITYTSAGHPPPVLSRTDGTVVLLDRATEPPLGVPIGRHPRAQAMVAYTPGDTLVLYTDGLTERRGEDIDAGLQRLADVLVRHARLSPDRLADVLLTRLGVADGGRDDVALIVIRL
ncbi:PP2C family protein-serine/threonine phosphatase [Streptomyces sp. NPDC004051]